MAPPLPPGAPPLPGGAAAAAPGRAVVSQGAAAPQDGGRELVCPLQLTARSSSSTLETPRTATARSVGEKGTPRDVVRLALVDERPREPRERGAEQQPAGRGSAAPSPKCSARSAVPSTEAAWSTTPPSQCDSPTSARSQVLDSGRGGSGGCGGCGAHDDSEAGAMQQRHLAWTVGGAAEGLQVDPSRFHLDLQKRLEVIRFVTMRENQKLKDAVQQVREQIARRGIELGCDPHAGRPPPPPAAAAPPPRWPRRVQWRVDGAALLAGAPPPRHGLELPGCPGVALELELEPAPCALRRGAAGASSGSAAAPRADDGEDAEVEESEDGHSGCRLVLSVAGPPSCSSQQGEIPQELLAGLRVEPLGPGGAPVPLLGQPAAASAVVPVCRGQVTCAAAWRRGAAVEAVLCHAEVAPAGASAAAGPGAPPRRAAWPAPAGDAGARPGA